VPSPQYLKQVSLLVPVQYQPDSMLQLESQPSLLLVLPSSHSLQVGSAHIEPVPHTQPLYLFLVLNFSIL